MTPTEREPFRPEPSPVRSAPTSEEVRTTKVTVGATKLRQLKELTGSVSDRAAGELALGIALGIDPRRGLVARIAAHGYIPQMHEETIHGAGRAVACLNDHDEPDGRHHGGSRYVC